jgi:Phosphoserine phosphatase RsbU, N-terminal domain
VADPVVDPVADLRRDYRPPFLSYLTNLDERGLTAAYDLGRRAMLRRLGLLELVRVHNEVYVEVVSEARTLSEAQGLARAAAAFLLEALAPFEMTQRGFMAGDGLST